MAIPERALKRLQRDYMDLLSKPVEYVFAHPLEDNILEWNYVIRGPKECPFYDGIYHGKLVFPKEFPLKPPSIYMFTPNGRFQCNVRLCLTISDYHPETWSPLWTVSAVLTGLLSFMLDNNCGKFIGFEDQSEAQKKKLAQQSWSFNLKNEVFCQYFPELANEAKSRAN